ncbi:MAG TPA: hypothetical protein VFF60_12750 [Candidatus Binatus sp.]|nr:hypothetical protein [Candidatus Binatus sp.]
MKKLGLLAFVTLAIGGALVAWTGSSSKAANTPAPTPMVSVTTLPALPSPGAPTAHPVNPVPTSSAAVPMTPVPAGNLTPAPPPPGTVILIDGAVASPMYVTLDQLQKMRSVSITQKISGHGVVTATGVPLAAILAQARPTVAGAPDNSASAYALVSGVSSQLAIVAFPEFLRAFQGKLVILAYLINGKPSKPGAATLIVQGDASGGRFIQGVTHIQVVQPSPSQ